MFPAQIDALRSGKMADFPRPSDYAALVPLIAPLPEESQLKGILALGALRSGLAYSDEDQPVLNGLANQVSMAIYMRQMLAKNPVILPTVAPV